MHRPGEAWREKQRVSAQADEEALELIGRLPLVPICQLVPLSGDRSGRSVYACVARLSGRGLVSAIPGPTDGRRTHRRLLLISNLGLAVLAWRRDLEPADLAREWRPERRPMRVVGGPPARGASPDSCEGLLHGS